MLLKFGVFDKQRVDPAPAHMQIYAHKRATELYARSIEQKTYY